MPPFNFGGFLFKDCHQPIILQIDLSTALYYNSIIQHFI